MAFVCIILKIQFASHIASLRISVRCCRGFHPLGCDAALSFEGTYLLHHKGFSSSRKVCHCTLEMKALPFFQTSIKILQAQRRHIPGDLITRCWFFIAKINPLTLWRLTTYVYIYVVPHS